MVHRMVAGINNGIPLYTHLELEEALRQQEQAKQQLTIKEQQRWRKEQRLEEQRKKAEERTQEKRTAPDEPKPPPKKKRGKVSPSLSQPTQESVAQSSPVPRPAPVPEPKKVRRPGGGLPIYRPGPARKQLPTEYLTSMERTLKEQSELRRAAESRGESTHSVMNTEDMMRNKAITEAAMLEVAEELGAEVDIHDSDSEDDPPHRTAPSPVREASHPPEERRRISAPPVQQRSPSEMLRQRLSEASSASRSSSSGRQYK